MTKTKTKISTHEPSSLVPVIIHESMGEKYRVTDKNKMGPPFLVSLDIASSDMMKNQWKSLPELFTFPAEIHLCDVVYMEDQARCMAFVVVPDYLIDITAVANCFSPWGAHYAGYFIQKFTPFDSSIYLLIGNIVNYFLDELLYDPSKTFQEILPDIFGNFGLSLSLLNDREIKDLISTLQTHFQNLKRVVQTELEEHHIDRDSVLLESSFYSPDYGLQGRMDALIPQGQTKGIIELKSGKVYKPNEHGLTMSHYVQIILYHVLSRSSEMYSSDMVNYILYSKLEDRALRYAPPNRTVELEAIAIRNEIVIKELSLDNLSTEGSYLDYLDISEKEVSGFNQTNLHLLKDHFTQLNDVERAYVNRMIRFLSIEYHLSKIGTEVNHEFRGQSSLWKSSRQKKIETYSLLDYMIIEDNYSDLTKHIITLSTTDKTPPYSNFREGDIIVLYPTDEDKGAVFFQLFKGSVISYSDGLVTVQLRYAQKNQDYFSTHKHWSMEPDFMDSSFSWSFRVFDEWASLPPVTRSSILNLPPQSKIVSRDLSLSDTLTDEQCEIVEKAISSEELFLIWGPPGTGKTSYVLRELVRQEANLQAPLLVIAYTNRAVDEICDAIFTLDLKVVRIGSEFSVSEQYKPILLQNQIKTFTKRNEILSFFEKQEVVVGTLSSIMGKTEIFKILKFSTVIIDEASQILEPQILGILSRVKKKILIGDHTQLPAVVVQEPEISMVIEPALKEGIGLSNCRNSYFERMYTLGQNPLRSDLIGMLSQQGRMHPRIMKFVSEEFYEGQLEMLPDWQSLLPDKVVNHAEVEEMIQHRLLFIDCQPDTDIELMTFHKRDEKEAMLIVGLVQKLISALGEEKPYSVGIIAPFRAQVTTIKNALQKHVETSWPIDVDTVERFQGSSRDIIFYSTCVHSTEQLDQIVSLSDTGKDRKLNVVLSRGKEIVVVVGNHEILQQSASYAALTEKSYHLNSA